MEKAAIIDTIPSSPIRKMYNMALGKTNLINFVLGEPDFDTPENIIEAAHKAMLDGQTHYTPNAGILPLRQAITKRLKEKNNVAVDPESEVIVTIGGTEALLMSMMSMLNPGDEVIVSDPFWSPYIAQLKICRAVPKLVKVYEEDGFAYRCENVEAAVTPKTRGIIINSPANPTGGVIGRKTLEGLAELAKKHNLFVISDEVYQELIYDGEEHVSIASFDGMKDRTIVIDSFSKAYAMTGWRIGYAAGCKEIIKSMVKLQENFASCVHTPTQYAAIEALEGTQEPLKEMLKKYISRRKLIIQGINEIDKLSCISPKGAFYAFANISKTGLSSEEFAIKLFENTGVVVIPGSGFGSFGEGFIRISYAASEEKILEGLRRMRAFTETLK